MRPEKLLEENYKLKTTVVGLVSFVVGLGLLALARRVGMDEGWSWLSFWPLGELGGVLVGAGLLGVIWDYFDGKDREIRDDARVRRLLQESAPHFTDAVRLLQDPKHVSSRHPSLGSDLAAALAFVVERDDLSPLLRCDA